jgi:hypothetical protein
MRLNTILPRLVSRIASLFSGLRSRRSRDGKKPSPSSYTKEESIKTDIDLNQHTTTMSLPKTYKRAAFREQGGPLTVDEVPLKLPGDGQILIKVEACGVCHSDVFVQYNVWGVGFPMAPGHEIIGRVAAVGAGVEGWKAGDRVGGAWHGGQCQNCDRCKAGLIQFCEPYVVNGVTQEGGCKSISLPRLRNQQHRGATLTPLYQPPFACSYRL